MSGFAALEAAALPEGWRREARAGRFGAELRFLRGDDWMATAVARDGWTQLTLRRPALLDPDLAAEALRLSFPEARRMATGEINLRLDSAEDAETALAYLLG